MKAEELTLELGILKEQVNNIRIGIDRQIRSELEKLQTHIKEQAEKIESLKIELAKTQEKLANHLLNYEKHDNRRWTLVGFFIASLLALMANLIVTFTRR